VSALWPERVRGLVTCNGYNIQDLSSVDEPADPKQAVRNWYQWYFNTARGKRALECDPAGVARECWRLWSPSMVIDEAAFLATSLSWRNEDHAEVVAHSYRHRHGEAAGDPALESVEMALLAQPVIEVPAIVLDPAEDGVSPLPDGDPWARRFSGPYQRRIVERAGHFLPRERPEVFAQAVRDLVQAARAG
jgi:pimeloyl-ACP methyl ester carboxylesterase